MKNNEKFAVDAAIRFLKELILRLIVNTKTNRQRGSKKLQICSLVNLKLVIFSIDLDSRDIFFPNAKFDQAPTGKNNGHDGSLFRIIIIA